MRKSSRPCEKDFSFDKEELGARKGLKHTRMAANSKNRLQQLRKSIEKEKQTARKGLENLLKMQRTARKRVEHVRTTSKPLERDWIHYVIMI